MSEDKNTNEFSSKMKWPFVNSNDRPDAAASNPNANGGDAQKSQPTPNPTSHPLGESAAWQGKPVPLFPQQVPPQFPQQVPPQFPPQFPQQATPIPPTQQPAPPGGNGEEPYLGENPVWPPTAGPFSTSPPTRSKRRSSHHEPRSGRSKRRGGSENRRRGDNDDHPHRLRRVIHPEVSRLDNVVEGLLLILVVIAPWLLGGVLSSAMPILGGLAVLAAALGFWNRSGAGSGADRYRNLVSPLSLTFAGLALFALIQAAPLPSPLFRLLDPTASTLLNTVSPNIPERIQGEAEADVAAAASGPYRSLSRDPEASLNMAIQWMFAWIVFQTTLGLRSSTIAFGRVCTAVIWNGVALCLFGIIQALTWNGMIYWCIKIPQRDTWSVSGPFVHNGHMLDYMNIALGLSLSILIKDLTKFHPAWKPKTGNRGVLYLYTSSMLVVGVLITGSRAGVPAAIVSTLILLCLMRVWSYRVLLGLGGIAAIATIVIVAFGVEQTFTRLSTVLDAETRAEDISFRFQLWSTSLQTWRQHPLFGQGQSAFPLAILPSMMSDADKFAAQAENLYITTLVEGGLLGLGLCLFGLVSAFSVAVRAAKNCRHTNVQCLVYGVMFGACAVAIHSFTDFGAQLPAIGGTLIVLCAHLQRLADYPPQVVINGSPPAPPVPPGMTANPKESAGTVHGVGGHFGAGANERANVNANPSASAGSAIPIPIPLPEPAHPYRRYDLVFGLSLFLAVAMLPMIFSRYRVDQLMANAGLPRPGTRMPSAVVRESPETLMMRRQALIEAVQLRPLWWEGQVRLALTDVALFQSRVMAGRQSGAGAEAGAGAGAKKGDNAKDENQAWTQSSAMVWRQAVRDARANHNGSEIEVASDGAGENAPPALSPAKNANADANADVLSGSDSLAGDGYAFAEGKQGEQGNNSAPRSDDANNPQVQALLNARPVQDHLVPALRMFRLARNTAPTYALSHIWLAVLNDLFAEADPPADELHRALLLSGSDIKSFQRISECALQDGLYAIAVRAFRRELLANPKLWADVARRAIPALTPETVLNDMLFTADQTLTFADAVWDPPHVPQGARFFSLSTPNLSNLSPVNPTERERLYSLFLAKARDRMMQIYQQSPEADRLFLEGEILAREGEPEKARQRMTASLNLSPQQHQRRLKFVYWLISWNDLTLAEENARFVMHLAPGEDAEKAMKAAKSAIAEQGADSLKMGNNDGNGKGNADGNGKGNADGNADADADGSGGESAAKKPSPDTNSDPRKKKEPNFPDIKPVPLSAPSPSPSPATATAKKTAAPSTKKSATSTSSGIAPGRNRNATPPKNAPKPNLKSSSQPKAP